MVGRTLRSGFAGRAARLVTIYARAVASLAYLVSFGLARREDRALLHQVNYHFAFKRSRLPVVAPETLLEGRASLVIHEPSFVEGNVSILELAVINAIILRREPRAVFEIGTFDGRTTLNIARHAPESALVYTLDLPREELGSTALGLVPGESKFVDKTASGLRFAGSEVAGKIRQLYGDSARFDFAPYAGQIDLVFVDGSHAYAYVINDSERALELLRGGRGSVLWHDYHPSAEGVFAAINDLHARGGLFAGMQRIGGTSLVHLEL